MKKSKLIATAVLASTLGLAGCNNGTKECSHVDEKAPWHICDLCGAKVSDHYDNNHDHKCDLCDEKMSDHVDENRDHLCDVCGEEMSQHNFKEAWSSDAQNHWHDCEFEGCSEVSEFGPHKDDDKDHFCDDCNFKMSEHDDGEIVDHKCDYCGEELVDLHYDNNHDHNCDLCEVKMSDCAEGEVVDHMCDYCGAELSDLHYDNNHDHHCDVCDKQISYCHDENKDGNCDVCENPMPVVSSVNIKCLVSTIGTEGFARLSAEVVGGENVSQEVVWSLSSSSYFEIESFDANSCIVKSKTTIAAKTVTVTAKSVADESVTATFDLKTAKWSNTSKNAMNNNIFEVLPYFATYYDFAKPIGESYITTSASAGAEGHEIDDIRNALLNGGFTETEVEGKSYFRKESVGSKYCDVVVRAYYSSFDEYNIIDAYLESRELLMFPVGEVEKILEGKSESEFIVPAGSSFFVTPTSTGNPLFTINGGDAEAYMEKLYDAGYYSDDSKSSSNNFRFASPERTMVLTIDVKDDGFTLKVSTQTIPTKEDWTSSEYEKIHKAMDGLEIPFINAGFSWNSSSIATSSRVEAFEEAMKVLDGMTDFVKSYDSDMDTYSYVNQRNKYVSIQVDLYRTNGTTYIEPFIDRAIIDTWDADFVKSFIGKEAQEEVFPAPEGTAFQYYAKDPGEVQVIVSGQISAYITALTSAGYIVDSTNPDDIVATSPNDVITMHLYDFTWGDEYSFGIVANGHLPTGYSYECPVDKILKDVGHKDYISDVKKIPVATGTLFFYEKLDNYDVSVTVYEGGSMSAFEADLVQNGFVLNGDTYVLNNVGVKVTAGVGSVYSARIYLIDKPVGPVWPDLSAQLSAIGYAGTLPAPSVYSDVSDIMYDSTYECDYIVVTSTLGAEQYANEVDAYYYYGEYCLDGSTGYIGIYDSAAGEIRINFYVFSW